MLSTQDLYKRLDKRACSTVSAATLFQRLHKRAQAQTEADIGTTEAPQESNQVPSSGDPAPTKGFVASLREGSQSARALQSEDIDPLQSEEDIKAAIQERLSLPGYEPPTRDQWDASFDERSRAFARQQVEYYRQFHGPEATWEGIANANPDARYTNDQRRLWEQRQAELSQLAHYLDGDWDKALNAYVMRGKGSESISMQRDSVWEQGEEAAFVYDRYAEVVSLSQQWEDARAKNDPEARTRVAATSAYRMMELRKQAKDERFSPEQRQYLLGMASHLQEQVKDDMSEIAADWTEEDYKKFLIQTVTTNAPGLRGLTQEHLDLIASGALDEISGQISAQQAEVIKAFDERMESPEFQAESGYLPWLVENWQALLVPAGIVAALFGGNMGKVLGIAAIAVGGHNLYSRYSTLMGDPEKNPNTALAHSAIQQAMTQVDEQGNPAPFASIDQAAQQAVAGMPEGPERNQAFDLARRSLRDVQIMLRFGYAEQIKDRVREHADSFGRTVFGIGLEDQQEQEQANA